MLARITASIGKLYSQLGPVMPTSRRIELSVPSEWKNAYAAKAATISGSTQDVTTRVPTTPRMIGLPFCISMARP